ncbi:MAG: RbsD/FucU family protein [Planctomycetota bacterium]|nr:RbsD/FucU family protein [Planctomycetota bacterium]
MLKSRLLQPQILEALALAGHSSKILIADGNYPASTKLGPNAALVHLNLSPGLVSATQVLEALVTAIPIEAAEVMQPMRTGQYALHEDPPIFKEFGAILKAGGVDVPLKQVERFKFYDIAGDMDVALTIATGEQRIYGNLLLTIGVVKP